MNKMQRIKCMCLNGNINTIKLDVRKNINILIATKNVLIIII